MLFGGKVLFWYNKEILEGGNLELENINCYILKYIWYVCFMEKESEKMVMKII